MNFFNFSLTGNEIFHPRHVLLQIPLIYPVNFDEFELDSFLEALHVVGDIVTCSNLHIDLQFSSASSYKPVSDVFLVASKLWKKHLDGSSYINLYE